MTELLYPFRAPKPLHILNPSNFVPEHEFPVEKDINPKSSTNVTPVLKKRNVFRCAPMAMRSIVHRFGLIFFQLEHIFWGEVCESCAHMRSPLKEKKKKKGAPTSTAVACVLHYLPLPSKISTTRPKGTCVILRVVKYGTHLLLYALPPKRQKVAHGKRAYLSFSPPMHTPYPR